jgi:hypothetical protein
MRNRLLLALPLMLAIGLAAPAAAQSPGFTPGVSKLRLNGIGKVFTGMTVKKARKAAGSVRLRRSRVGECVYLVAGPNDGSGPTLRFHNGRLRQVHVGRSGYATRRGVEVGDRVRKVVRRYKNLSSRPNLGGGRDLIWKKGKRRLIFSVGQGKVFGIAGGRAPWVLWQECV